MTAAPVTFPARAARPVELEQQKPAPGLAEPQWPQPLPLAELAGMEVPAREYRVGNIMALGTVGLVTGHGGAGKTQMGLHLACCLTLERPFFGFDVRRSKVAFVSAEDDARELHYRLALQARHLGVSLAELAGGLFAYDLSGADSMLLADGGDGRCEPTAAYWLLTEEIEQRAIDVLILDNLMALFAGNVNDPAYVTRAMALLGRLVPAGGNVVVHAHVDKMTARAGHSSQAYSGTAAWHNRARWRWFLYAPNAGADAEPGEEPEGDDGRRILEVQKNNAGPAGARVALRLVEGAMLPDGVQDGLIASIRRDKERRDVLAAVREADARGIPVPTAETNRNTAYEALETMPSYPDDLRGRTGKRRLFRLLRQLRADSELEVREFPGRGRHMREGYCPARIEK